MRITLKTKAICNGGNEYEVHLDQEKGKEVVLKVDNTPGQWCVSDLIGIGALRWNGFPDRFIYIDFGQDWRVVNFDEILREALPMVTGKCYLR
jgi:hypothetical protein